MELKQVSNIEQPEYVTKSKMNQKILKKNKPSNWLKAGITGFIFSAIMNAKKAFASSFGIIEMEKGESVPMQFKVPDGVLIAGMLSTIPMFIILITIIRFSVTKKNMPEDERKKWMKRLNILINIAIVLVATYLYYRILDLFGGNYYFRILKAK